MKIDFRPMVYMRDRTHTYLWIKDENGHGHFLTMDTGTITVETIPIATETELIDGKKVHRDIYRVYRDGSTFWDLAPYPYDPMKAIRKYHESFLGRSPEAEQIMRRLLGLPVDAEVVSRQPEAQRPSSTRPAASKQASSAPSGGGYSLAQLCTDLKIEPGEARKVLRSKKIEKPGARWEWASAEAASHIREALS